MHGKARRTLPDSSSCLRAFCCILNTVAYNIVIYSTGEWSLKLVNNSYSSQSNYPDTDTVECVSACLPHRNICCFTGKLCPCHYQSQHIDTESTNHCSILIKSNYMEVTARISSLNRFFDSVMLPHPRNGN